MIRVFPSGKLPAEVLKPSQNCETEQASRLHVRHLAIYHCDKGEKFAVFPQEPDARQ